MYTEYDGFYFDDFIVYSIDTMNALTSENISSFDPGLKLYPNPASDKLYVRLSRISDQQLLRVNNALGQEVYSKTLNEFDHFLDIDTRQWQKGMYYIYLSDGNRVVSPKKILKH